MRSCEGDMLYMEVLDPSDCIITVTFVIVSQLFQGLCNISSEIEFNLN